MKRNRFYIIVLWSLLVLCAQAQTVTDMIKKDPSYAACNYRIYPDSVEMPMTPPPDGKKPFYIIL